MISRLGPRDRFLLVLAAVALASALLVLVLFRPLLQAAAAARREARRAQGELVRMTDLAQRQTEIERRHAEGQQAAAVLVARIPPEPDLPDLITQLDGAIGASRVLLMQISFQGEAQPSAGSPGGAGANVGFLPVQLRVMGSYPQLRTLVTQLEQLSRVVVIDRLVLTGADRGIVAEVAIRALFLR